jgi:hypothetical protein
MAISVTWWDTTSCISRARRARSAERTVSSCKRISRLRAAASSAIRVVSSLRTMISRPMATGMPATMTP